jgi:hypothetical protein
MAENSRTHGKVHRVELNLRDVNQLFNTIDPSPFNEKDLDHDAEEFIVSWTREFPLDEPVVLVIYLSELPAGKDFEPMMEQSIQNYFAYRARLIRMEFRQLMKDGRRSLLIGGLFLATCLIASNVIVGRAPGPFLSVARESLTHRRLGGDVAADGDFSLRMVAAAPTLADLRKNEPNESGSAKAPVIKRATR